MKYDLTVGLEVHSELSTESKIYCSCSTKFGQPPNTQICPICTGMPGVLPVLNKKVVEYAIKAGLATNCSIAVCSKQDRKNYFYPDLPKAYQISQYDIPICYEGYVTIELSDGTTKNIRINRIHIEEDAGKLIHDIHSEGSLLDYNRCGVPLIEIVTEPDIKSIEEAKLFLETLRSILQTIGVSDCKMQEGSYRCDVNISINKPGEKELGIRTEVKNLNSIRSATRSIEFEYNRQINMLENGHKIKRETLRWDDVKNVAHSMRSKEIEQDYRYLREPDLPKIVINQEWVDEIKRTLPELPAELKIKYMEKHGLSEYDATQLANNPEFSKCFKEIYKSFGNAKVIANWLLGDISKLLNAKNMENIPIQPSHIAELLNYLEKGTISNTIAKKMLDEMFSTGESPAEIIKKQNLAQISNQDELTEIINKIINENPQSVADYRAGKEKAFGFLIGQAMKATKGQANPKILNELTKKILDNL